MPKRKHSDDDSDYIKRKIKKLERKLARSRRKHRQEKSLSLSPDSPPQRSNIAEPEVAESAITLAHNDVDETGASGSSNLESQAITVEPTDLLDTSNPSTTVNLDAVEEPVSVIDSDILAILGDDPTVTQIYGKEIQNDLAIRLKHYASEGLTKEARKELTGKYLTPSNCTLIDPPILNVEIKAAVTDVIVKRDKAIEAKQKQLASAISSLSHAITLYISTKCKEPMLLKLLMDTIRILCDSQHAESITRKNFILFALKKEVKSQLQLTKIDKYLFSENLPDVLKSAKAINKSVSDLKPPPTPAPKQPMQNKRPAPSTSKNWRAPPQARRQLEAPRTVRESAHAPQMKNRPTTSSKTSSQHRFNQNRR